MLFIRLKAGDNLLPQIAQQACSERGFLPSTTASTNVLLSAYCEVQSSITENGPPGYRRNTRLRVGLVLKITSVFVLQRHPMPAKKTAPMCIGAVL